MRKFRAMQIESSSNSLDGNKQKEKEESVNREIKVNHAKVDKKK